MKEFHEIVEHWAEIYRPMQHVPGRWSKNNRFFLTDSYMGLASVVQEMQRDASPSIVMESNVEGILGERFDTPRYSLYFLVLATGMSDGQAALQAKLECKQHMKKFIAYLRRMKEEKEMAELAHIDLDDIEYMTTVPMFDGWYAVGITLTDLCQYDRCVDANDYINEQ